MISLEKLYIAITCLVLLSSCQDVVNDFNVSKLTSGKFVATVQPCYVLNVTRSKDASNKKFLQNGEMSVAISEEKWNDSTVNTTRSNVSGLDYTWESIPYVALYIQDAEATDNMAFKDIPLNPVEYTLFDKYYNPNDLLGNSQNSKGNVIGSSSFFWNEWTRHSNMPQKANFYGYCPRPCDVVSSDYGLKYTAISILDRNDARNGNTNIKYAFLPYQDDTNISYHDIMCSVSEGEDVGIQYGNTDKEMGSNIQLRFKHMFSLLEIEVDKGSYQGPCRITDVKLSGSQIYTSGVLDVLGCKTMPSDENSEIVRSFEAYDIKDDSPFKTTMITQPTTDNADGDNADGRLIISCTIDGAKYSCPLPNAKFEAGKKYKINLTLKPSEILDLCIWDGASVIVGGQTYTTGNNPLTPKEISEFKVTPNDDNTEIKVFRNGEAVGFKTKEGNSYVYDLSMDAGKKTTYNIVTYPLNDDENKWYFTENMRIHFDAKWNNKYVRDNQCTDVTYWSDLSGHDNDGLLKSFDGTKGLSGWNGSDGLDFDGIDDIVTFFGDIGEKEYTLEFFLNTDSNQSKANGTYPYKRLIGEPDMRTDEFVGIYITGADLIGFVGQGIDTSFGCDYVFGENVQYDIVYENRNVIVYINGEKKGRGIDLLMDAKKKQTASLGNRIMDNSRALKATFHSFIMYDKALTEPEIKQNYATNRLRYN